MADVLSTDSAWRELRRLATEAGFDQERPALEPLWSAVVAWVRTPVTVASGSVEDDLLFECSLDLEPAGPHRLGPGFSVGFTRQFSFYDESDEYLEMKHVGVDLGYAVHDDFRAITEMAEWSTTFGTADLYWGKGGTRTQTTGSAMSRPAAAI